MAWDLLGKVKTRQILTEYGEAERDPMWSNICSLTKERSIPSLFTLFEDVKFLRPAAMLIKQLMPPGQIITRFLREPMFRDMNQESNRCMVQISEMEYRNIAGSSDDRLYFGIQQIWGMATRAYDASTEKRNRSASELSSKTVEEIVLFRLAMLACELGFDSEEIQNLLQGSPDRQIARKMLRSAKDPEVFRYDDLEGCVDIIEEVISRAEEIPRPEKRRL